MANVLTATPSMVAGQVQWTLCDTTSKECGIGTPQSPYPTIQLAAGSGPHDLIFVINDPTNSGLTFASGAANAFWVDKGKGVHLGAPVHNSDNQIGTVSVPNGAVLIVPDQNNNSSNKGPLWLSYRLNFSDGSSIDPDIKNGGGGNFYSFLQSPEVIGYALISALVIFVVGVWIGRMTKRRPAA